MKKSIAILLTLVAIQSNCFGQSSLTDSLRSKLSLAQEDTTKILLYAKLTEAYVFSDPDSGFYYGSEGLRLARAIKFPRGEAWNMFWLSVYFRFTGSSLQAMLFASKALAIFNELNDMEGRILCTQMLGWTAQDQRDYVRALEFCLRTQRLSEQYHNFRLFYAYTTIAQIYQAINKLDSALVFANKALAVMDEKSSWPISALADIHKALDNDSLALHYYHEAIRTAGSVADSYNISSADAYIGIASLFYKMRQMDSAAYYARKTFSIAEENNFMHLISASSEQLASIYELKRAPDSVVKYLRISAAMKDSLFNQEKTRQFQSLVFSEKLQQQEMQAAEHEYQNRVRSYVLLAVVVFVLVVALILYRNNSVKKKVNVQLQNQKEEIETTLEHLTATQNQLIQREKMASLGELTAGVAHEIQNPLNFVNNFSEVNKELLVEMKEEIENGNFDEVKSIAGNLIDNQEKINHHGKRADSIVKGMLQHSRISNAAKEPSNINAIADEYFRLAYHGLRAKDKSFNAKVSTSYDETIENINIVRQDIGRVILNLVNNAFYAVHEKSRLASHEYQPEVELKTKKAGSLIEISVRDNGNGIPSGIVDKIFQPFFTTKPTGQGTGLGLSLSYDIVKAHGGDLKVETMQGKGAEFTFSLPSNKAV